MNPELFLPIPMERTQRKVPSACERCRKQKLKCDVERPCTLCVRANTTCVNPPTDRWRFQHRSAKQDSVRGSTPRARRSRSHRQREARAQSHDVSETPAAPSHSPVSGTAETGSSTSWNMSSTMTLVEQAFHHHDADSPEGTEASALLARPWAQSKAKIPGQSRAGETPRALQRMMYRNVEAHGQRQQQRTKHFQAVEQDLMSLLPEPGPAEILVDNYFDRIHWYTLVFHQSNFRSRFKSLYEHLGGHHHRVVPTNSSLDFVALCLTVFAISLRYTGDSHKRLLETYDVEPNSLRESILTVLKLRSLDLIALGSLEMVQVCVLLGSYYLYDAEPEMAWPLCGAGLRIAQALNLHRKVPISTSMDASHRQNIEARRRTWWAVYEIETFCSMLYGFPLSISDGDCDVEPLNPRDEFSQCGQHAQDTTKPTLLHFKTATSELSAIVRSALVDLYGTRRDQNSEGAAAQSSRLAKLVTTVANLSRRLSAWHASLPETLQLRSFNTESVISDQQSDLPEATQRLSEVHIFRLQALSLKLSYENARILIHRPLLSFKSVDLRIPSEEGPSGVSDPFQQAMTTCRDAALQISSVGSSSCLAETTETFAIASVSLHLLTAGVTLCISMSLDPLSWQSYESRMGIRRLMQIQSKLKERSDIASQGLEITKRLISLAMAKEIDAIFEVEPPEASNIPGPTAPPPYTETASRTPGPHNNNLDQAFESLLPAQEVPLDTSVPLGTIDDENSWAFEGQNFDFCENTSVTDALLEYEEAIGYPTNTSLAKEQMPLDPLQNAFLSGPSLGQEQGWIWGWNPLN